MKRNDENSNFFNTDLTLVLNRGSEARDYREICTADADTIAWDLGSNVSPDGIVAVSTSYKGVFAYARITPVARKESWVGGNDSNGLGYRVKVQFLRTDFEGYLEVDEPVVGWVKL